MMKKLLLTTALVASFGISSANASSINGIISGLDNLLSDNSAEYLINANGGSDTIIDLGDRLRGILGIDNISNSNGVEILSAGGNSELTAIFDVTVTAKTCDMSGDCVFEFGPTASFQAELDAWGFNYAGGDAAIAFFEDTTPDFNRGAATIAAAEATSTDGDAFWLFGFDNIDDYWVAESKGDDINFSLPIPGGTPENTDFGDFAAALTLLENPYGQDVASSRTCASLIGNVYIANADTCAIGNLLTPTGSTPYDSFDDVNFVFDAVPEPASLGLLGLGLMGIGFAARRRK